MTLKEVLLSTTQKLKNSDIESPAFESGVIICHVLKKDKGFLYTHPEYEISNSNITIIEELVKRRCERVPLQYLLGSQEFMSLDFKVNSNVLIPRHDTEVLVETLIDKLNNKSGNEVKILDIGTGSGCIAISLAKYIKAAKVTAIDISEEALNTAKENAVLNSVSERVEFVHSNLFEKLTLENKFDCIVSNPPYIPTKDIYELQPEVRLFEPFGALDGGNDGYYFYKAIIKKSPQFLKKNAVLAFEVGIGQARTIAQLMQEDFEEVQIIKDLGDIERVVIGQLSSSKY